MNQQTFRCEECKLHYNDEQLAKDCAEFCRQNNACNLEITSQSIEHQNMMRVRKLAEESTNS